MEVHEKPVKTFGKSLGGCLLATAIVLGTAGAAAAGGEGLWRGGPPLSPRGLSPPDLLAQGSSVAGTYRCRSFNVGGAGRRCTSPPLVLHPDGTYQMSSERGTYTVEGDQVILSESKIRGPGRLQGGNEIVFEYEYRGLRHTVAYMRQEGAAIPPPASTGRPERPARVPVEVTLRFSPSDGSVGWINSASLIPEGGAAGPEALARTDGKTTVEASFRSVETGRVYTLFVSSGFERRPVGKVDLREAAGPVAVTLDVPPPKQDRNRLIRPRTDAGPTAPVPAPEKAPSPSPDAPRCDPNVPRYAQPGCRE